MSIACFSITGGGKYKEYEKKHKDSEYANIFHRWRSSVEQIENVNNLKQDINALNKAKE